MTPNEAALPVAYPPNLEMFSGNLEDVFNPEDEACLMFAMEDEDDILLRSIDLSGKTSCK